MTYDEFRSQAITSAELYYAYLDSEGKGIASTAVRSIICLNADGLVKLQLFGRLSFISDIQVKIYNRIYSQDEIQPVQYDDQERSFLIRPRDDLKHLLFNLSPGDIFLISDLKFLVMRVRNWYKDCQKPLSLPQTPPVLSPAMPELAPRPSLEQEAAFHGVFNCPLSYIWGAPGTGKTQFVLARAALAYFLAGKKILITAPTNNAVEQTLKGVLAVFENAGLSFEKVLRLGIPSKEFYEQYPMVCEVRNVENELEYIEAQLKHYQKCRAYFNAAAWVDDAEHTFHENVQKIQESDDMHSILQNEMDRLESKYQIKQANFAPIFSQIRLLTAKKNELAAMLSKKRSPLSAWLHRKKLDAARQELASVDISLQNCGTQHAQLLRECEQLQAQSADAKKRLQQLRRNRSSALRNIQSIPPCPFPNNFNRIVSNRFSISTEQDMFLTAASALLDARAIVDSKADLYCDIAPDYVCSEITRLSTRKKQLDSRSVSARLSDCLIVAATLDNCITKLPADGPFQPVHIFLDEAAYCPLIKSGVLLSYHAPLTLLGDHMQLPPVCEAPDEDFQNPDFMPVCLWAQSALYIQDLFQKSMERIAFDYLNAEPPEFDTLKKFDLLHTFRFGEDLAHILARFVYTHAFQGNRSIKTDIAVVHVPKQSSDGRNVNPSECAAIKNVLSVGHFPEYAILTPFRRQRALLANLFPAESVFTIHGSQGREWDVVILSVVVTSSHRFLSPRLINTAVSRAKKKLILVCDSEYWSAHENHLIGGIVSVAEKYDLE